jgi:hypothetical protein
MSFPLASVTGSAVTGLTSPTYTCTADAAPVASGKQFAITALGGTQPGVRPHSISSPFTVTWFRDPAAKQLPPLDQNGALRFVPNQKHRFLMRVGLLPLAGQSYRTGTIRVEFDLPVGAETADSAQLKAAISCLGGIFHQYANDHYNTLSTGVM